MGNFFDFFGLFWAPWRGPGPPQGSQNGPRDPGDRFKIPPKFLKNCSLPLTGKSVVTRVYSNLAVLDLTPEGFKLKEMCEQIDFDLLQKVTEAKIISN